MRWLNTKELRSTISALFAVSTAPPSAQEQADKLEVIRRKMLALAALTSSPRSEALARRIRYAVSVESLWFSRGELMGQLAKIDGEAAARERVDALGKLFQELLPRGLHARTSPLDGSYRSSRPAED
ncbi:hypothetical protein [Ramlibacter alkalitolerans]|uniref:Uncharacterized protein n=1 Tax=Ramlibacter alkalitolerans TaxID=2039631 RepID=A0ABS1JL72_9BURK|nr:hypothetical protein [Ramlibacter alkalitolerans]MBL0424975.1 hypothetical protein [Ramlibacter alkalitolerans]